MTKSTDELRRDATALKKACHANDRAALTRVQAVLPPARTRRTGQDAVPQAGPDMALKHADFLHLIAREQGFASWPRLVAAAEATGMDRA